MERVKEFAANGITVELPSYFPSISSFKTNCPPYVYIELMGVADQPNFLVSAFDLVDEHGDLRREMIDMLNGYKAEGKAILLDSGNYEKFWHKDPKWNTVLYEKVLRQDFCTFCFSYDGDYQSAHGLSHGDLVSVILKNWESNAKVTKGLVAPIIHSPLYDLINVCTEVAKECDAKYIAVPERELGSGIMARYNTVKNLREALNVSLGRYIPIHILGTGNPFSLLILSYAGADTFDGLEWCQTAISSKDYQVYHFQLGELINGACSDEHNYDLVTLLNNLKAYKLFNFQMRTAYRQNTIEGLLSDRLPESIVKRLG